MDAGFIFRTYLLSRTQCHVVLYRTYGTVYLTARIFDRCIPRACARNITTLLRRMRTVRNVSLLLRTVRVRTERNVYFTVASRALARSVNPCLSCVKLRAYYQMAKTASDLAVSYLQTANNRRNDI